MKRLVITSLVLGIAFLGFQAQAQANLLSDPGFENGGGAISLRSGPWTWSGGSDNNPDLFGIDGNAYYESSFQRSGAKSAKLIMWGNDAMDWAAFCEEFRGLDYTGEEFRTLDFTAPYYLSGYFMWSSAEPLADGSTGKLQLRWRDVIDRDLRVDESALFDNINYVEGTWHAFSLTTTTPPPVGTFEVAVGVALNANVPYTPESAFYIDDMDFDVVPEPASLILFGSGLFGLLALRLRKK